ncbi:odorant receptor 131-2-like [Girardinichthys multiradiatus]|uniref:odorant receptor 131-2-like n=1 Tax=Girardinichthys multiradiatus TaxID=208333 RepID=UPI001FAE48AF|nr:odorant receptor 131-2-like [Girardinichthys multiradiatus]
MSNNSSVAVGIFGQQFSFRVMFVQILVIIFLCINMLLIATFFKKECFHNSARHILFAVMLLSDSFVLILSDFFLVVNFLQFDIEVWLCTIISIVTFLYVMATPVTLTAMTLERYVAICLPLRHAELCSTRRSMSCILIIHGVSSVPCILILTMFFATASFSFYKKKALCSVEIFILHTWQRHLRSAVSQLYFLIMCIIIIFCYIQIVKVAKAASIENKQSTQRGLRTVILHAFQLLLCLIQLWTPFTEAAALAINVNLFLDIRYFNYVMFSIAPRCLSPLIYGLRDEIFCLVLKNNICFSAFRRSNKM